jgi:hypothetical protein
MKWLIWIVATIALASCATASQEDKNLSSTVTPSLPNYGPAPELTNDTWLNTDQPLRLADLRGKVVLLDMWTFG